MAAFIQANAHNPAAAGVDLFGCLVTLLSPLLLRHTGRLGLVTHAVLALVFGAVLALIVLVRGAGLTGATVMLAVLPLCATLIMGVRPGAVWLLLSLAAGVGIGTLGSTGRLVDHLSPDARLLNDHIVLAVFTLLLFALATVFENRKDESLRQISELETLRRTAELDALRSQAAAQLAHAEQFASLGRIAGAAAHELNNPLAYVLGNMNFVAASLKSTDDPEVGAALREALEGAERIHRIVRDLGAISRPNDGRVTSVVVRDAIASALQMAEPYTASRARVQTKFGVVPPVVANESRLIQVVLNLVLDAARAIPDGNAAEHEIAIEVCANDGRVVIEVADTGRPLTQRGFPEGGGVAQILGETVARSFGGQLVTLTRPNRTVVQLSLNPSTSVE